MRQARGERSEPLALAERLKRRRAEIEETTLLRVRSLADPPQLSEAQYAQGLQRAVAVALDYGIEGIEQGEGEVPAPPPELISQARLAARNRVGLDVVMRRYVAGQALLVDFLISEAAGLSPAEPKRSLRRLSALLDRLLDAVSEAYEEERELRRRGRERRRAERIERLLAGEPLETEGLAYDFDGWHLGALAAGPESEAALRALARGLDCRLLLCPREEGICWAWLGSRRALDPATLLGPSSPSAARRLPVALGEPGEGLAGWRLTHRQAAAALPVARRRGAGALAYREVALLATVLRDDLLGASLRRLYLDPLAGERDGGEVSRETLRAYFAAEKNLTSAAAALGVNRNTVANRLRAIEERIGRRLADCDTELELALRLDELVAGGLPGSGGEP